jgi:hypothetical protein
MIPGDLNHGNMVVGDFINTIRKCIVKADSKWEFSDVKPDIPKKYPIDQIFRQMKIWFGFQKNH